MQLILILPLVPSHFVSEISRAKSRDHRHSTELPLSSSLLIPSYLLLPSTLGPSLSLAPFKRVTRKLKRCQVLFFFIWSEWSKD